MKALCRTLAVAGAILGATAAFAQDVDPETAARLDALKCSEFLTLDAQKQKDLMVLMRAYMNGEPLPDTPLPAGVGEGKDADAGNGEGAEGDDPPDETGIVDGENESGKVNPGGTEASVTDGANDPKFTALRTSCEGGPEAPMSAAMTAAHADYE